MVLKARKRHILFSVSVVNCIYICLRKKIKSACIIGFKNSNRLNGIFNQPIIYLCTMQSQII